MMSRKFVCATQTEKGSIPRNNEQSRNCLSSSIGVDFYTQAKTDDLDLNLSPLKWSIKTSKSRFILNSILTEH
jgi:hypothetical protein